MFRIPVSEQIERMSTLDCGDARQLPAFENTAQKSRGQVRAALAHRQVPRIVQNEAMTNVETGIPALVEQRKAVPRERAVRLFRRHQRIGRIINRVRVGVRALNLESLGEALRHIRLQAVIPGIARGFVEGRREERAVVYRRYARSAKPEIAERQLRRICTVSDVRGHQRRLRRITVNYTELMKAPVTNVVHVDGYIPQHLALNPKIPTRRVRQGEMPVDDDREEARAVGGIYASRHSRRQGHVLRLIERFEERCLLEGWIAGRVAKEVAKNAIVENSKSAAHGGFAVAEWIPCKSQSRLKVIEVVVVEKVSRARSYHRERESRTSWKRGIAAGSR